MSRKKVLVGRSLWHFEPQEPGQLELPVGELVYIEHDHGDGWLTVKRKDGAMGFVPSVFLDTTPKAKKGTLFGKRGKGSKEPPPAVPAFSKKASSAKKSGTRRFATNKGGSLADYAARYNSGGEVAPSSARSSASEADSARLSGVVVQASEDEEEDEEEEEPQDDAPSHRKPSSGIAARAAMFGQVTSAPKTSTKRRVKKKVKKRSGQKTPRGSAPKKAPVQVDEGKRTNIAKEILATEASYVAALREIKTGYMTPMRAHPIYKDWVATLFSNVEMVAQINEELLADLDGAITSFNAHTTKIGPIFQKMAPFLKVYNTYGNHFNNAQNFLQSHVTKDADFEAFLATCRGDSRLDLAALLIQPVQRIPRYRLLLEDLLKRTPEGHPDHEPLSSSLLDIQDVANSINESIRTTEQLNKVIDQKGLAKYVAPHRKMLTEAVFSARVELSKKTRLEVHTYLFTDIVVFFFDKLVRVQDPYADFVEMAWPLTVCSCERAMKKNGKTVDGRSLLVHGPNHTFTLTNKDEHVVSDYLAQLTKQIELKGLLERPAGKEDSQMPSSSGSGSSATKVPVDAVKWGRFRFPEGYQYEGFWQKGRFEGQGTLFLPAGLKVESTWKAGIKHGPGKIYYPTGEVYKGEFTKDEPHGNGRIEWPNGDVYEGYWLAGRRSGEGTFKSTYYEYVGSWEDGYMDGEGVLTFNGGGKYTGRFLQGKFDGHGELVGRDGSVYTGPFLNSRMEGEGKMVYGNRDPTRKCYEGSFKNSEEHGQGKMTYRDGSQYSGEWKEGKRHGMGIMTSSSQHVMRYEGMWADDTYNGKAKCNLNSGDWYEGTFVDGWMHGQGTYHYKNGTVVTGEWKMGRRQRKITLHVADKPRLELAGAKDKMEVGEAKINGKMHTYFLPCNKPCIDLRIVETECITPEK